MSNQLFKHINQTLVFYGLVCAVVFTGIPTFADDESTPENSDVQEVLLPEELLLTSESEYAQALEGFCNPNDGQELMPQFKDICAMLAMTNFTLTTSSPENSLRVSYGTVKTGDSSEDERFYIVSKKPLNAFRPSNPATRRRLFEEPLLQNETTEAFGGIPYEEQYSGLYGVYQAYERDKEDGLFFNSISPGFSILGVRFETGVGKKFKQCVLCIRTPREKDSGTR